MELWNESPRVFNASQLTHNIESVIVSSDDPLGKWLMNQEAHPDIRIVYSGFCFPHQVMSSFFHPGGQNLSEY